MRAFAARAPRPSEEPVMKMRDLAAMVKSGWCSEWRVEEAGEVVM